MLTYRAIMDFCHICCVKEQKDTHCLSLAICFNKDINIFDQAKTVLKKNIIVRVNNNDQEQGSFGVFDPTGHSSDLNALSWVQHCNCELYCVYCL